MHLLETDRSEVERWCKYIGVDDNGKANYFHKKPEYISGFFVPSEFRDAVKASSKPVDKKFENQAGKVFERFEEENGVLIWKELK